MTLASTFFAADRFARELPYILVHGYGLGSQSGKDHGQSPNLVL
jgi:hypothetical protein